MIRFCVEAGPDLRSELYVVVPGVCACSSYRWHGCVVDKLASTDVGGCAAIVL